MAREYYSNTTDDEATGLPDWLLGRSYESVRFVSPFRIHLYLVKSMTNYRNLFGQQIKNFRYLTGKYN